MSKAAAIGVKSLTSDISWPDNIFISGGNPHPTSRFCGVALGPTTIFSRIELLFINRSFKSYMNENE